MIARELSVQPATEGDLPEVLALVKLIQPHLKRSLEHLHWQYFESPGRDSRLYLAREPGTRQLVSIYGAVSQFMTAGRDRCLAWMIQDVMTHPEHRGRGHLHMLAGVCVKESRELGIAGYTFPNERSQMSFLRTGWTRVGLIPSREVPVSDRRPAAMSLTALDDRGLEAAGGIWKESGLPLGVARDAAYLAWRYRKPAERYELFSDGRDYFAALKLFDSPEGRVLHVLDLFTREAARHRVADLLAACLDFGSKRSAIRVTAWLPADHAYAGHFDALGFALKPRPERFFYADLPATVSIEPRFWHLAQGDSDVY